MWFAHDCPDDMDTWLQKRLSSLDGDALRVVLRYKQALFEIQRELPPPTPLSTHCCVRVSGKDHLLAKGAKCPSNDISHARAHGEAARVQRKLD